LRKRHIRRGRSTGVPGSPTNLKTGKEEDKLFPHRKTKKLAERDLSDSIKLDRNRGEKLGLGRPGKTPVLRKRRL